MKVKMQSIVLLSLYILFTAFGLVLYKYGTNINFTFNIENMTDIVVNVNIYTLIGLCFYVISFILYIIILPKYKLTDIMPILSAITAVLIYALAVLILKEIVTIQKMVGIAVIVIGVFIVSFDFKNKLVK